MKNNKGEITIQDLVNIFLPKIWIIVAAAVIFAGALGGYTFLFKDYTYTSKSTFVMVKTPTQYGTDDGNNAITTGLNSSEITAMQSMITMSEQILKTNDFLDLVKEELVSRNPSYSSVSIKELKDMLSIKIEGEVTVFYVSSVSEDANLAYEVADIVHDKLPQKLEEVFSSLSVEIKDIDLPRMATSPNSKGTVKNAIIGFAAGAILSMLVIFIISTLDVYVRSKEMLEDNFEFPIIGVIPHLENER